MTERLAFNVVAGQGGNQVVAGPTGTNPSPASDQRPTTARPTTNDQRPATMRERHDWAFTFTLLFTAVVFLRPQDILPVLEPLHLAEITALGGLSAMAIGRLRRGQSITRVTPELVGIILLGAIILGTAPFSIWMGGVVQTFLELYSKVILIYLLAVNVLLSPRRVERLTWVLMLTSGYIGFRATFDYVRGVNLIAHGTRVMGSVGGIMQNPNDLALNMVSVLPFAIFFALRRDSVPKRLFAAFCAACMVGAIVATGSRGGFLGFVAMLMVTAITTIRRQPGYAIAGAITVMCALPLVPQTYWNRLASITDESKDEYGTAQARRTLLRESLDAYLQNPITGVGAAQFKNWNPTTREQAWHESHDVWLQVAAELGTGGLIVFIFLVGRGVLGVLRTRRLLARVKPSRKRARRDGPSPAGHEAPPVSRDEWVFLDAHSAAMAAAIVGWIVCASFASVAYNWTFYYLLALAVAPYDILRARLRPAAAHAAHAPARPAWRREAARA